jgi:hypothetical protein
MENRPASTMTSRSGGVLGNDSVISRRALTVLFSTAAPAIALIIGGIRIKIHHGVARVDRGISFEDVAVFRFWNE